MIIRLTIFVLFTIISNSISAQFYTITESGQDAKTIIRMKSEDRKANTNGEEPIKEEPTIEEEEEVDEDYQPNQYTEDTKDEQKALHTVNNWRNEHNLYFPLDGKMIITSPYGIRKHPVTGKMTFHKGIDLRANHIPVRSMLDGVVEKIGEERKGGKYMVLRHGKLTVSYLHLSATLGKEYVGKSIKAGEIVAISGNTGTYSKGAHLHLQMKYEDKSFNPAAILNRLGMITED